MSIKSLFEDIADAIREKSGSSDTYTPAEMPSAILSIPSGSSTASGVSYDNTSSGLTASNVQDAIDELSRDVSTINSDLSELSAGQLKIKKYSWTGSIPASNTDYHISIPIDITPSRCIASFTSGIGGVSGSYGVFTAEFEWFSSNPDCAKYKVYASTAQTYYINICVLYI